MKKQTNKISNKGGFTLVETMIGLMILTMAIVAATSLLIGLIHSNKQIVKSLQAHYLAQEGLEAMRNIRDTNWMHNLNWSKGSADFLGGVDIPDDDSVNRYVIGLKDEGWNSSQVQNDGSLSLMKNTWELADLQGDNNKIYLCGEAGANQYFSSNCPSPGVDTGFTRTIEISKPSYCLPNAVDFAGEELCGSEADGKASNAMLVKSIVKFDVDNEIVLEEVLTNWKGGAL